MAFKIRRNAEGNCITFEGASQPVYWNACLSAEISSTDPTLINVINDIKTAQSAEKQYEFFRVPFNDFADADGVIFTTAQDAVDYINENANVLGLSTDGTDLTNTDVNFRLDDTSTSIIMDNGFSFGVNTIKAVGDADGTIHIQAIAEGVPSNGTEAADREHFKSLEHARVSINGSPVAGGINDVVNSLNELFTVGAFESIVISDPYSTMIADVSGVAGGYLITGANAVDPVGDDIFTNSSAGNFAGLKSSGVINQAGEYFTFDIRGEGQIGFGLVHTQASYDAENYLGNANYADPTTFATVNSAHYGFQFSHWFHPTPNGPWTNYGANTSYIQGPGWANNLLRFSSSDEGSEWLAGNPVKMKVGLDENGFIEIAYYDTSETDWVVCARTSYPAPEGAEFHLGIKSASSTARVFSEPKTHLIEEDDTPSALGDTSIDVFGEHVDGTLAGGIQFTGTDSTDDNDGFISAEAISGIGEYFEFTWSQGDANIGLFSENDHDVTGVQGDTGAWGNDDYIFYGARSENNGEMSNHYSENRDKTNVAGGGGNYYGRVGFDTQGRASVWWSNDGTSWTKYHHDPASAPQGEYKFIWVAQDEGANIDSLSKGQLSLAPTMNFRYIESPDNSFSYPLFATTGEAAYYDNNVGGAGTYHSHVYPDDPTFSTWYMPDTSGVMNTGSAPSGEYFLGNLINYTEITTLTNADLVPTAFSDTSITVDELSAVNVQIHPSDATWTTTIGSIPEFALVGHNLEGTAPEVTGDYINNPSDTTEVTVYRTNSYGTSSGILTVNIINLTAPAVATSGFAHVSGSATLFDSDTLDEGSAVTLDNTVEEGKRFIISKSWVESYVLPKLQESGDAIYLGVADGSADWTTIENADFDFAIKWEYNSASSHNFSLINVDGASSQSQTVNSLTSAFYDFAVEVQGTDVHLIACNVNAINNEPSVNEGGQFSLVETMTSYAGTIPLELTIATVSTQLNLSLDGIDELNIPLPDYGIAVVETSETTATFDGASASSLALEAGETYRFYLNDDSIESGDTVSFTLADGTTPYTTGVTTVGTHGEYDYYVEFVVPSDVPPLKIKWNSGTAEGISIVGSTYTTEVTGITLEGPAANQTSTNLFDAADHGWLSLNETLSAGERIVFSNAFLVDLIDAMPDNSLVSFGLKDTDWNNGNDFNTGFVGGARFTVVRYSSGDIRFYSYKTHNNVTISSNIYYSTVALVASNNVSAFLELTNTGNNVRSGFRGDNLVGDLDPNTTPYADWTNGYKVQTGDEGFGLTTVDVVVQARSTDFISGPMNSADVDWTALSEINIPQPTPTNLTNWSKALDFSGGSEYAIQVNNSLYANPITMGATSLQVSPNSDLTKTSNSTVARPWATAIVFKPDGNNSNQHIWNAGEGASGNQDNIYLRQSANGGLYFGWGREGAGYNECKIGDGFADVSGTSTWWGVYIAHKGQRFGGSTATAQNLADAFDIRIMKYKSGSWSIITGGYADGVGNRSTINNWNTGGTGVRMDRGNSGYLTIGGRGSNRNFHGKVASMVVTALRTNETMPDGAEIELMITDPKKWEDDYRVGQLVRQVHTYTAGTYNPLTVSVGYGNTQIWLMGDGALDSYANGIRNEVYPSDQNYSKLQLNSMVSNDIESVNIPGLS